MRIENLLVENLRGIDRVELTDLANTVVVAGQNGCGKSCLFDAIRLVKSSYGGYQSNEYMSFWSELQIDPNKPGSAARLLRDPRRQLVVELEIALHNDERRFISNRVEELAQSVFSDSEEVFSRASLASRMRVEHGAEFQEFVQKVTDELDSGSSIKAKLQLSSDGPPLLEESPLLELVFSNYEPQSIGIVDYHGAQRHFQREQLGGINLNLDSSNNNLRNHALYNYGSKYANIKSEMAAAYVRSILVQQAGGVVPADSLTGTLVELFRTFFPGKSFHGPRPATDGGLDFLVELSDGTSHDINELSSGEKEVLFGYLRLRSASPRRSVILIDEPELHLNPRLVRGLPQFYHRHLSEDLDCQLWLITHSDALLRETVGKPGFSVFHMQPPGYSGPQATAVSVKTDLERAIIDMVGDLATYKPNAKTVIFEGADPEFDVRMTTALFPELAEAANLLSGGNKSSVRRLRDLLERASGNHLAPQRFFAVVDRDAESLVASQSTPSEQDMSWDVYHIENYLLEPRFIREVLGAIRLSAETPSDDEVDEHLRECARAIMDDMVRAELEHKVYKIMTGCITARAHPGQSDLAVRLSDGVSEALRRLMEKKNTELSLSELTSLHDVRRRELEAAIGDGSWRSVFRGRDVLKRFSSTHASTVGKYEVFRNLLIDRMKAASVRPEGMAKVIDAILKA